MLPRFAVCIPNFNYGAYIGETISSVLDQGRDDVEICVSDNASTDDSVEVVRTFGDAVRLGVNPKNLGFAPNLDRAVALATAPTAVTLSSDDLMLPGALDAYARLLDVVDPEVSVIGAGLRIVDTAGAPLGSQGGQVGIWKHEHLDPELSAVVGHDVYSAPAGEILAAALQSMRTPFHFATVAYPRSAWERLGGYGGGRLINPDKWFNTRLLSVTERAYHVDADLFGLRWHASNQTAQQSSAGALKYLVDEYTTTLQVDEDLLRASGLTRDQVVGAFLLNDIALRGLRDLAGGRRADALRAWRFAQATYPWRLRGSKPVWALRLALAAGPLGPKAAELGFDRALGWWRRRQGGTVADRTTGLHRTWSHRDLPDA